MKCVSIVEKIVKIAGGKTGHCLMQFGWETFAAQNKMFEKLEKSNVIHCSIKKCCRTLALVSVIHSFIKKVKKQQQKLV